MSQDYGAYLEVDAVAAAASCREMEWALHEVLHLAEQCGEYRSRERYAGVCTVGSLFVLGVLPFVLFWYDIIVCCLCSHELYFFFGISRCDTNNCCLWPHLYHIVIDF